MVSSLTSVLKIIFLTTEEKAKKAKINKWDYIILISFCTANETIRRVKRQTEEQEKIVASQIS